MIYPVAGKVGCLPLLIILLCTIVNTVVSFSPANSLLPTNRRLFRGAPTNYYASCHKQKNSIISSNFSVWRKEYCKKSHDNSSLYMNVAQPPDQSMSIHSHREKTNYADNTTTNNNSHNSGAPSPLPYDKPLPNSIPGEDTLSQLSSIEQEFYSMMIVFSYYTPKDISTIQSPSYRALYEGVSAGSTEPLVMNAFAIIFSDLMPIRIAGRMIFKHLRNVMDKNIQQRTEEEERVMNETGLSLDAVDDGRRMFMAALGSGSNNDEGSLTMTELIDSGIVETVVEIMEYESFDEFVREMEQDKDEKINFEKFMVGLQKCALTKNSKTDTENDDGLCDVSCDLEEVLSVTTQRIAPIEAKKKEMTLSQRKKKYSDRYDDMVKSFEEWETLVPSGDGRMIQVLEGCFAGAKNEKIVNALKIVYMDYSALRVGGDLVFKLMGKLVNRRKRS